MHCVKEKKSLKIFKSEGGKQIKAHCWNGALSGRERHPSCKHTDGPLLPPSGYWWDYNYIVMKLQVILALSRNWPQ